MAVSFVTASLQELGVGHKQAEQHAPSDHVKDHLTVYVDYRDPYVQPLILAALESGLSRSKFDYTLNTTWHDREDDDDDTAEFPFPPGRVLQILQYESLSFSQALSASPGTFLLNSYVSRRALIRKHYLAHTVRLWAAKHPESILATNVPVSCEFEVDYAEFLDEALEEAWELRESLKWGDNGDGDGEEEDESSAGGSAGGSKEEEWWVLKPGMSEGANGIRLFQTEAQLRRIFEAWDPPDSDDEEEEAADGDAAATNGVITSHLRHFITQKYIHSPLLLPSHGNRKFHIRTYVICSGALKVHVYRPMLALFATEPYLPPWRTPLDPDTGAVDLRVHLTNTCFANTSTSPSSPPGTATAEIVASFWNLPELPHLSHWKRNAFTQICGLTSDLFTAAYSSNGMMNFQPLPCSFEIFGLDFLVDSTSKTWLLEVNAFPDFARTGDELGNEVVGGLWEEVARNVIRPYFFPETEQRDESEKRVEEGSRLVKVLDVDLRR